MGWVSIVFWILTHVPSIISLVKEVLALLHSIPVGQRPSTEGITAAIRANDPVAVKVALENFHRDCSGMAGCPSDLVSNPVQNPHL